MKSKDGSQDIKLPPAIKVESPRAWPAPPAPAAADESHPCAGVCCGGDCCDGRKSPRLEAAERFGEAEARMRAALVALAAGIRCFNQATPGLTEQSREQLGTMQRIAQDALDGLLPVAEAGSWTARWGG